MRAKEFIVEADSYSPPTLNVGDRILKGKFKNSPAEIKGFTRDKHNQPVLKTDRGDVQLFKPRVAKLMDNGVAEGRNSGYKEIEFVCANPEFSDATDPDLQKQMYAGLKQIPGVIPLFQDQSDYSEGQYSLTAIYKDRAVRGQILKLAKQLGVRIDLEQPVTDDYVNRAIRGEHEGQQGVAEGLSIDVPNEQWLQDKIDYAKSKGRDEWGAPFFGTTTAYVRPNPQVSVVRLELLKGMRNEQNNVRKTDLEWLMAYMEKTGKLPPDPHGNEYAPYVMVAYNGEAWVNEGNHRIMAAFRLGWKKMPIEIKYFDGGERVESGIMYPGKIGLGRPAANPVREAYTGPQLKWLKPGELRGSYTDQQMRDRGFDRAGNGKWFILQDRWNELIAKKGIQ